MGLVFLISEESIMYDVYKEVVLYSIDMSIIVICVFFGKYVCGIWNEFIERYEGKEEGFLVYLV